MTRWSLWWDQVMDCMFTEDPHAFWREAGAFLAAEPVQNTVINSWVGRVVEGMLPWPKSVDYPRWFAIVRDEAGVVVGAAMRTAEFAPHPAYVLPMSLAAAEALAEGIVGRGESHAQVNGATPAARVVAERLAAHSGQVVGLPLGMRLHEVRQVVAPDVRPGVRVRRATPADAEQIDAWLWRFHPDAAEQAGRVDDSDPTEAGAGLPDKLRAEIAAGVWWVADWQGEVAHMTAARPPAFGVARLGPVYTPPQFRGLGLAKSVVAEASAALLAQGARVCLFTDVNNPVSNQVYADVGYEPVAEFFNLPLLTR